MLCYALCCGDFFFVSVCLCFVLRVVFLHVILELLLELIVPGRDARQVQVNAHVVAGGRA